MTFAIQSLMRSFTTHAKVLELIDLVTKGWNVLMIKHNFWANKAKIILQIPLSKYW
jgi:hypothetical protein